MFSNRKLVLALALLIGLALTAYVLVVIIPRHAAEQSYAAARRLGQDLREALQFSPEITVENKVIVEQETAVLELATVSQRFHHAARWTNTRFGSTKEINVSGAFEAKAGFDLDNHFSVDLENGKATVIFPEPELLSVTPDGDISFRTESGLWNWVSDEDRTVAVNRFIRDAKNEATSGDLLEDARQELIRKLVPLLRTHANAIEIRIGAETYVIDGDEKNRLRYEPL